MTTSGHATGVGRTGPALFGNRMSVSPRGTTRAFITFDLRNNPRRLTSVLAYGDGQVRTGIVNVRVNCPRTAFDAAFTLLIGSGREIELPRSGNDCTVRSTSPDGHDVRSYQIGEQGTTAVLRPGSERNLSSLSSDDSHGYVAIVIDDGESDFAAPLVVGAPGESLFGEPRAGMVQVFATFPDGRPDPTRVLTLRQGRTHGGRAEAGDGFGTATALGDFDGDGWTDVAVGAPGEDIAGKSNAGMVHIVYLDRFGLSGRPRTLLTQNSRGVPDAVETGDRFGAALTALDFDLDGDTDLAVGAPGESFGTRRRAGTVAVIHGGPLGMPAEGAEGLSQRQADISGQAERRDEFGSALAANGAVLVVGAPGETVRGRDEAGVIHLIDGVTRRNRIVRQGYGLPGSAEAGDRFGSVLAARDDHLVIGVPDERVGTTVGAGAIIVAQLVPDRPAIQTATFVTQADFDGNSVEAGDRFGSSVDISVYGLTPLLVVGSPGETVAGHRGAGAVLLSELGNTNSTPSRNTTLHQDSSSVPDGNEPGDAFGHSVQLTPHGGLAIGAPGETVSGRAAGQVTVLDAAGAWSTVNQDTPGVPGAAESGDRFGGSLAA